MSEQQETSKLAIASLVLAVLFCVPLAPFIGMILGIIALVKISQSGGRLGGQTLAIIAIAVGLFSGVANLGMLAAIAIPNFIKFQQRAKTSEAKLSLQALSLRQKINLAENKAYISCTDAECKEPDAPSGSYQYACTAVNEGEHPNYTCAAWADLDGDGDEGLFVVGSGNGSPSGNIVVPIPKTGDLGNCLDANVRAGDVVDCKPYEF